ncbi:MAG: NifU family protein [Flavobacteriales bacterium]
MSDLSEITTRVERALEGLRPYLEADGGDIQLVEVTEDLKVRVELHGACADCQMIHMTMKGGVEQAIRQAAPEVVKVEAINWTQA